MVGQRVGALPCKIVAPKLHQGADWMRLPVENMVLWPGVTDTRGRGKRSSCIFGGVCTYICTGVRRCGSWQREVHDPVAASKHHTAVSTTK